MISDHSSPPYIQIIPPLMREARAAIDAMLHHETELPIEEMMVDTAGFTELMYALYDLQGFKLSPRIRDLGDHCLFPLPIVPDYGVLNPLFRGPTIRLDLVKRGCDVMYSFFPSLTHRTLSVVLFTIT